MRYSFSAEFLKVVPPETTFGNAWESLCYELLVAEYGIEGLQRLNAPDSGIDILRRLVSTAIQCKSDERGMFGSLSATESVKSLKAAVNARPEIDWGIYKFATNANYTGSAVKKILSESNSLDIAADNIDFLGPEYWNNLCDKYFDHVRDRFDFRVTVTEEQVIEAFRKARYFDKYVDQYADLISKGDFVLKIKNNWTPVELELPFSPDLSVENCVDAVQELLGVSLKWTNFADLGTSTGPSIALTVNQQGQTFKQTIGEVKTAHSDQDMVFWITLVWKDRMQDDGIDHDTVCKQTNLLFLTLDRSTLSEPNRQKKTLERAEEMVQAMIWDAARRLKHSTGAMQNS